MFIGGVGLLRRQIESLLMGNNLQPHLMALSLDTAGSFAKVAYIRDLIQPGICITALCTTSFTPPSGKKYYFATVRGLAKSLLTVYSNCSERMCLHARTFLVALENYLSWPGELP